MNIDRLTASGYPSVYESFPDRLSCLEMVIKANIKTGKKSRQNQNLFLELLGQQLALILPFIQHAIFPQVK